MRGRSAVALLSTTAAGLSPRPTHFLAFRLGRSAHERVRELQAAIIQQNAALAPCAVPPEKSHMTLFVLHAATPKDIQEASNALSACAPIIDRIFGGAPPTLAIRSLGNFGTDVLFCHPGAGPERDRLCQFVADVHAVFQERGVVPPDASADAWVPHVTVLKTSRAKSNKRQQGEGKKARQRLAIRRDVYEGLEARLCDLGEHTFMSLELCAMVGRGKGGFYPVVGELALNGNKS